MSRIFILGHAGGDDADTNTPSVLLRETSGFVSYAGPGPAYTIKERITGTNIIPKLAGAIRGALDENGVFVLGSCGHAKKNWLANLKEWAATIDRPVAAIPHPVMGNPIYGTEDWGDRVTATPDGTIINGPKQK